MIDTAGGKPPIGRTNYGIATWSRAGIYMQYARYSKNSFRFAASTLWNSLPDHLKFCFLFAYIFLFFICLIIKFV